MHPGEKDVYV
jgi:serine/threonine protein phosphatase PrpC